MATASIAKLAVILTADTSQLTANMGRAQGIVRTFNTNIGSTGSLAKAGFKQASDAAALLSGNLGRIGQVAGGLGSTGGPLALVALAAGAISLKLAAISDAQRVAAGGSTLNTWAGQWDRVQKSASSIAVTLGRPIADVMARETGQIANILEGISQSIMPEWQRQEEMVLKIMQAQKAAVKELGDMKDRVVNLTKGEADAYRKIQTEMTELLAKQKVMGGLSEAEAKRFERLNQARNALGFRRDMREFDKGAAAMEAEKFRDLESRAKSLTESLRTPREDFVASLADAAAMFEAGVLNAQGYQRAAAAAKEKFREASQIRERSQTQANSGIAATDRFTMAGFSAVQQASREMQALEAAEKEQIEELKKQTEVEQEIAKILNDRLGTPIILMEGTPP
jgi:hypothetical protein